MHNSYEIEKNIMEKPNNNDKSNNIKDLFMLHTNNNNNNNVRTVDLVTFYYSKSK